MDLRIVMESTFLKRRVVIGLLLLVGFLAVVLTACVPERTQLERVLSHGKLTVVTRHAATTYYEGPHGPAGLEYELLRRFADRLGVELVLQTPDSLNRILTDLTDGDADLAAAGLTAIEVWHPRHDPDLVCHYQALAAELGLVATGGSDFHGGHRGEASVGDQPVPSSVLRALKDRAR